MEGGFNTTDWRVFVGEISRCLHVYRVRHSCTSENLSVPPSRCHHVRQRSQGAPAWASHASRRAKRPQAARKTFSPGPCPCACQWPSEAGCMLRRAESPAQHRLLLIASSLKRVATLSRQRSGWTLGDREARSSGRGAQSGSARFRVHLGCRWVAGGNASTEMMHGAQGAGAAASRRAGEPATAGHVESDGC